MIDEYRAGHINRRTLLRRLTHDLRRRPGGRLAASACGDSQNAEKIIPPPAQPPDAGAPPDARRRAPRARRPVGVGQRPRHRGQQGAIRLHRRHEGDRLPGAPQGGRQLTPAWSSSTRTAASTTTSATSPGGWPRPTSSPWPPISTSRGGTTEMLDPDMARTFLGAAMATDLIADLNAGVDFLGTQPGILAAGRIGVTGFCFGGGYTYRTHRRQPQDRGRRLLLRPHPGRPHRGAQGHQRGRPHPPRRERQQRQLDHRPAGRRPDRQDLPARHPPRHQPRLQQRYRRRTTTRPPPSPPGVKPSTGSTRTCAADARPDLTPPSPADGRGRTGG